MFRVFQTSRPPHLGRHLARLDPRTHRARVVTFGRGRSVGLLRIVVLLEFGQAGVELGGLFVGQVLCDLGGVFGSREQ